MDWGIVFGTRFLGRGIRVAFGLLEPQVLARVSLAWRSWLRAVLWWKLLPVACCILVLCRSAGGGYLGVLLGVWGAIRMSAVWARRQAFFL